MEFLKKLLLPIIIFVVVGGLSLLLLDSMALGTSVFFYVLGTELFAVLYFWNYQIMKSKTSGIFYIYLSLIVVFDVVVALGLSFLYASGNLGWVTFLVLFWVVIGLSFIVASLLKLVYRGVNDSISNQTRGEHGLAKMKDICRETMFILEQNKKDASEAIKILKEVEEALEYSDPVTHKNVYSIEKNIVSELKDAKKHAKNKLFGKINAVMKDSNGVLYLIEKRNTILKNSK